MSRARSRRRSLTAALIGILALTGGLVGCARGGPAEVEIYDLAAELTGAEVHREQAEIDFGTGASEPFLLEGFSWNETSPDGTTFAWSDRSRSVLELFIAEPRPLRATLRLLPLPAEDAPSQAVSARLNGQPLGAEIELAPGWNEIELVLPVEAQRGGSNRLELHYRWTRSPDARHLAVAWDRLRLAPLAVADPEPPDSSSPLSAPPAPNPPLPSPPTEPPRAEGRRLALPAGTHLDYFLSLPAGARFAFDRLAVRDGGELAVEIELPGAPPRALTRLRSSPGPGGVDLGIEATSLARLRLQTLGGSLTVVDGPAIVAPGPKGGTEAGREGSDPIEEPARVPQAATARRPNLLIYLVDTLRADHLGCYGYRRPTSPRLDAFAREAVLFERAFAQSSWTKASVASIFAGVWPRTHGLHNPEDAFAATLPTLPQLLRGAGYRTGAVTTNAYISREAGFGRGFEHFVYLPHQPNRSTNVHRKAVELLDAYRQAYRGDQNAPPFFLYLHTIDPHAPYAPPEPDRRRFAPDAPPGLGSVASVRGLTAHGGKPTAEQTRGLLDLYDGEIAFNDRQFGRLLEALRARDLYDNTLIVFVSDHGEAFQEHGVLGHGWDLYRETLQVPLVIKPAARVPPTLGPGALGPGTRTASTAQHLDLLPTLLRAAGVEPPPGLPGRDLLALAEEGDLPLTERGRAFSFLRYSGRTGASLVVGDWHLSEPLTYPFGRRPELFDLRADPLERHDLLPANPVLGGYLRALLRTRLNTAETADAATRSEVDDETRAGLRALGYLD